MRTAAVSMCKDELDVVDGFVQRMCSQVDLLIVADNNSTDGTRQRLDELAREHPLTVIDDPEIGYFQARKMTRLAAIAADMGADWVICADFDEVWYSPFGRIADVLAEHDDAAIATAELYDHVATAQDPADPDPFTRLGWRRIAPAPLQKVAVRPTIPVRIEQGNHGARYDTATVDGLLVIRHYPWRSPEQAVRKVRNGAAAYAATSLPQEMGSHWRGWGRILHEHGEDAIADLFRKWHWRAQPRADAVIDGEHQPPLIYDPAPAAA